MRRLRFAVIAATLAVGLTGQTVAAMPGGDVGVAPTALLLTPVAMGCGPGRSRDAIGLCRHKFNRFQHHEHFRAYERRHCTVISTPNGRVKRCRI